MAKDKVDSKLMGLTPDLSAVKREHVRVGPDGNATVKFKPLDRLGNVVRATMRGMKPLFVRATDKGWDAGVRGDSPVHAKTPDQAFAKAARQHWQE